MNVGMVRSCVAALVIIAVTGPSLFANADVVAPTDAPSLIKFVGQAGALVAREGENCFPELRRMDGPWFVGDTYVIVTSRLGETMVNPAFSDLEGKNVHDLLDVDGRAIVGLRIRSVSWSKGAGWANYRWPEPGEPAPRWKSTYSVQVTAPSGRLYVVSSGLYDLPLNRLVLEDTVNRAAERVAALGPDAFAEISDKLGPYRFRDTATFVMDDHGQELVSPDFPELVGRNVLNVNYGDPQPPAQVILNGLKTADHGWFEYHWPKAGETAASRKSTYARRVQYRGRAYIVAAGMFLQ